MRLILFVAPLFLGACALQDNASIGSRQSTANFLEGYRGTLPLNQMSGSAATIDQVKYIASHYVYNVPAAQFENVQVAGYRPAVSEGVNEKGLPTLSLNTGNGGAYFVFDKGGRLRDAMPAGTGQSSHARGKKAYGN